MSLLLALKPHPLVEDDDVASTINEPVPPVGLKVGEFKGLVFQFVQVIGADTVTGYGNVNPLALYPFEQPHL